MTLISFDHFFFLKAKKTHNEIMASPTTGSTQPTFLPRETNDDLKLMAPPLVCVILNLRHFDLSLKGQSLKEYVAETTPPAQFFCGGNAQLFNNLQGDSRLPYR